MDSVAVVACARLRRLSPSSAGLSFFSQLFSCDLLTPFNPFFLSFLTFLLDISIFFLFFLSFSLLLYPHFFSHLFFSRSSCHNLLLFYLLFTFFLSFSSPLHNLPFPLVFPFSVTLSFFSFFSSLFFFLSSFFSSLLIASFPFSSFPSFSLPPHAFCPFPLSSPPAPSCSLPSRGLLVRVDSRRRFPPSWSRRQRGLRHPCGYEQYYYLTEVIYQYLFTVFIKRVLSQLKLLCDK